MAKKGLKLKQYDPRTFSPDVIKEFFIVKRSTIEMMKKRGFNTSDEDRLSFFNDETIDNMERFLEHYLMIAKAAKISFASALNQVYDPIDRLLEDPGIGRTITYFFDRPVDVTKTGSLKKNLIYTEQTKKFSSFIQVSLEAQVKKYILVLPVAFDSQAQSAAISNKIYEYDLFLWEILGHGDISRHKHVPYYEKLTQEEKRKLFNGFLPSNLPKIHTLDYLAKYNGWRRGDIIKMIIYLPSSTHLVQKTVEYRLVI